jgi:hypothetical protein
MYACSGTGFAEYKVLRPVGQEVEHFCFRLDGDPPQLVVTRVGPSLRWNGRADASDATFSRVASQALELREKSATSGDLYSLHVELTAVESPKSAVPARPTAPKPLPTTPPIVATRPVVAADVIDILPRTTKMAVGLNYNGYLNKYGDSFASPDLPWDKDFEAFVVSAAKVGIKTFRFFLLCDLWRYGSILNDQDDFRPPDALKPEFIRVQIHRHGTLIAGTFVA